MRIEKSELWYFFGYFEWIANSKSELCNTGYMLIEGSNMLKILRAFDWDMDLFYRTRELWDECGRNQLKLRIPKGNLCWMLTRKNWIEAFDTVLICSWFWGLCFLMRIVGCKKLKADYFTWVTRIGVCKYVRWRGYETDLHIGSYVCESKCLFKYR